MGQGQNRPAYVVALCALMAALGTAVMMASGLIPILTYCSPMAAAVALIPVREEFGRRPAWMTWTVTAVLSLLLCADKEAAFFYLFLGYYPILKPSLDRIRSGLPRLLGKLAFFALSLGVMYGLLLYVLRLEALLADLETGGLAMYAVLFVVLTGVMLIFDRALDRMARLYRLRRRPRERWRK